MMKKRALKTSLRVLIFTGVSATLLLGSAYWLVNSQSAPGIISTLITRWVPEISIESVSGTFRERLQIGRFIWSGNGVTVTLDSIKAELDTQCLLSWKVCAKTLKAKHLQVDVQTDSDTSQTSPGNTTIELPNIPLPFALQVDQVELPAFLLTVNKQELVFSHIQGQLNWVHTYLDIKQLSFQFLDYSLDAQGRWIFSQQYRPELKIQVRQDVHSLLGTVLLSGSLEELRYSAQLSAPYPLSANGSSRLLDHQLTWNTELTNFDPFAVHYKGEEAQVSALALKAQGTLEQWTGKAFLEGDYHTRLHAPLSAKTEISYKNGKLNFNNISLNSTMAAITGRAQLNLNQGFQLESHWNIEHLDSAIGIEQLHSKIKGQLDLAIKVDETLEHLQFKSDALQIDSPFLKADLAGQVIWRPDDALLLKRISLSTKNNRVEVNSATKDQYHFDLDIADLSELIPAGSGRIMGSGKLHWKQQHSELVANINGENIRGLGSILTDFALRVDPQPASSQEPYTQHRAFLKTGQIEISSAETSLSDSQLIYVGSLGGGTLAAYTNIPELGSAKLNCRISNLLDAFADQHNLVAHCLGLDIDFLEAFEIDTLSLKRPAILRYQLDSSRFIAEPFCLKSNQAEICTEHPLDITPKELDVNLAVKNIPWLWARHWIPEAYHLTGTLNGRVKTRYVHGELESLTGTLSSFNTTAYGYDAKNRKLSITPQALRASIEGDPTAIKIEASLELDDIASANALLRIDRMRNLEGELALREINISPIAPLIEEISHLNGTVASNLKISGTIDKPLLTGNVFLSNGALQSYLLPWSLSHIESRITLTAQSAQFSGSLLADSASASFEGSITWSGSNPQARILFTGNRIHYQPFPYSHVYFDPNLTVTWEDNKLDVEGEIRVPEAFIKLKQLPEDIIEISDDAVIVSDSGPVNSGTALQLHTNLQVLFGDNVRFQGFGLNSLIGGGLNVTYSPAQLWRGNGVMHIKEGRYKAYGQNLKLVNSDLIFVGSLENPTVHIEAIRDDLPEDITVGIRAFGLANNPDVELFSIPAMSDQNKLQYLLTGQGPDETTSESSSLLSSAALSMGTSTGENLFEGLADKIGIKQFQMSASDSDAGTEVQVSGYLNSRLFVRYGINVFDNTTTLTMRYRLRPGLILEAVSSTATALDLLWTFHRD